MPRLGFALGAYIAFMFAWWLLGVERFPLPNLDMYAGATSTETTFAVTVDGVPAPADDLTQFEGAYEDLLTDLSLAGPILENFAELQLHLLRNRAPAPHPTAADALLKLDYENRNIWPFAGPILYLRRLILPARLSPGKVSVQILFFTTTWNKALRRTSTERRVIWSGVARRISG